MGVCILTCNDQIIKDKKSYETIISPNHSNKKTTIISNNNNDNMNENENLYSSYPNKKLLNYLKNKDFVNNLKNEKTEPSTTKSVDEIYEILEKNKLSNEDTMIKFSKNSFKGPIFTHLIKHTKGIK